MKNIAIVVTDVQIAVKANRNANEGFYFCTIGSAYPKIQFDTILFTCVIGTEVLKKWASGFIKNGLADCGVSYGFTLPIEETPLNEPENIPETKDTYATTDMSKQYKSPYKKKKTSTRKLKRKSYGKKK